MNNKIYIVVTPFFPSPERWQGAYCYDFVKALEKQVEKMGGGGQWNVLVFKPGGGEDYEYQGVRVYRFPVRQLPSNLFPHLFDNWNKRSFLGKLKEVLTTIVDLHLQPTPSTSTSDLDLFSRVSVCHGHTRACVIYPCAIKELNPKCLTLMHHHDPGSVGLRNGRFHRFWLQRWSILSAVRKYYEAIDCHVFISKMVEKSFKAFPDTRWTPYEDYRQCGRGFGWMKPFKVRRYIILHNGVDTAIFNHEVKVKGQGQQRNDSSQFVIGCVANLEDWKDPITLVKACVLVQKKLSALQLQLSTTTTPPTPTIKLVIVGSGADVPEMKRLADEGELNMEIRSEVDHTQLPAFYHELDLFVLPSCFEGFGCVFTEAYASGVPFITCEGQGMDDLVADAERSLWFCKQRNPSDLATKILNYIKNRPTQHLKGEIEIGKLVKEFVKALALMEPGEGVEPTSASNEDAALTLS